MAESDPVDEWKGEFGNDYIRRNEFTDWKLKEAATAFGRMLKRAEIQSVLEVGCNVGINLAALTALYNKRLDIYAVEPNEHAIKSLADNPAVAIKKAFAADAYRIPMPDASVDLIFTCGVLIHIPSERLEEAVREIYRVSRKYILCCEYFSQEPDAITYHGKEGLLFKRDFGAYYLDTFPGLTNVDYGFLWQREFKHFDNLTWWLFEKPQQESSEG